MVTILYLELKLRGNIGTDSGYGYYCMNQAYSKLKHQHETSSLMEKYRQGMLEAENFPITNIDIPNNIRARLQTEGYKTAGDIAKHTSRELLRKDKFGPTALKKIELELSKLGLNLKQQ